MTRIEFVRGTGRWLMVMLMLAAGGFLLAARRISLGSYCAAKANCTGCGLNRVCHPREEDEKKSDEKE
jgi:hypothetical protein